MKRVVRRTLAVVLALSLVAVPVVSHTSPQAVQTAKAEVWGDDCTTGHSLLLTVTNTAGLTDNDLGCTMFPGDTGTEGLDHNQTKTELVQRAGSTNTHSEVYLDSFNNSMQSVAAVARMEGQAAYYRALENGSTKAEARSAVNASVRNFISVKEYQLAQSWTTMHRDYESYYGVKRNESLDHKFVNLVSTVDRSNDESNPTYNDATVTLANDTTVDTVTVTGTLGGSDNTASLTAESSPNMRYVVAGHSTEFANETSPTLNTYPDRWNRLQTAETSVTSELSTYVGQTYDQYEAGSVNSTDLIDANTLAREFGPNETSIQSWTSLMLSLSEDVDAPEDMDGLGNFTVAYQGTNHTGLLLADSQEFGTIETGRTYDGTNYTVTPKVVESSGDVTDLDGKFTVHEITDSSGSTVGNVTYREVTYQTTNTTEYQQLMDEMDAMRSELEAREEKRQGGVGWLPGSDRQKLGAVVLILGGGYLVARTREQSGVTVRTDGPPRRGR